MTFQRNASGFGAAFVATLAATIAHAGQAPGASKDPDIAISHRDRVFAAEQFSNTVSVVDPASNTLLGVIRLGDPQPQNFSPLYRGQVLVHGMGVSPDNRTLAVVSIGSNSVTFIDTATNAIKHTTYVGRSPHEAAFTRDGAEVWVTVRGESYLSVIDTKTFQETARITTPNGPGMVVFSPDGVYAYLCSSFTPEADVITVKDRKIVARMPQASPFCPNIAVTADGEQVWYTLKDTGAVGVFNARPPFNMLKAMATGPITNHVNFVDNANGKFAYVTVGGLNLIRVFRREDFSEVATIPVGKLPHGLWPSGDGTRVYVGLENQDRLVAIDTLRNSVIADIPIGQAPQALVYAPGAAIADAPVQGLTPLAIAGEAAHLTLAAPGARGAAPTSVSLFDQGLVQVLQAAVSGVTPGGHFVLALAERPDGGGPVQPLMGFVANPAGAAIVDASGPIRQIVLDGEPNACRRYLVILAGTPEQPGAIQQVQRPD